MTPAVTVTLPPGLIGMPQIAESADADRIAALRAGDEQAFVELVDELGPRMLRLARAYVTGAVAEEVVQEAWIVVLRSLDRFERRSTLATWIFGIVVNVARARGRHEHRSRPFSSLAIDDAPVIDPDRFLPPDHERWPGHWAIAPMPWPDRALETSEATQVIRATVATLPQAQKAVITLRDMVGCTPAETCRALGLTDANQRVLLHRARTKVRAALEAAFERMEIPT
jgi:RNA polymerase sigma-70 factor (ECF subfamily)